MQGGLAAFGFGRPSKRAKLKKDPACTARDPRVLVTWNCCSLPRRLEHNWEELKAFLEAEEPDVVLLTETWLPAAPVQTAGAKVGDGRARIRGRPRDDDKKSAGEFALLRNTLLDWCATESGYDVRWSCNDGRKAGTGVLLRHSLGLDLKASVSFDFPGMPQRDDPAHDTQPHHKEGRVIRVQFPGFELLGTYAPNLTGSDEGRARKAAWGVALAEHAAAQRQRGRRLVWCGDLNACFAPDDVSHPRFFRAQMSDDAAAPLAMRGQPACTPAEVEDLRVACEQGDLLDAWAALRQDAGAVETGPQAVEAGAVEAADDWDAELSARAVQGPHYTWRGAAPAEGSSFARYYRKGMRIDHFCVSAALLPRLRRCVISGRGVDREHAGSGFMGSDHCPIILEVADADADAAPAPAEAEAAATTTTTAAAAAAE